jgi:hypothetical protein
MTRIIVDNALRTKLQDLTEPLELCDESGRILARVLPTVDSDLYEGLEPRISQEELRRRRENKGQGYTTAQVLAHLESL